MGGGGNLGGLEALLKELYGMKDSRSSKGIMARGSNIYKGGSTSAHSGGGTQFGRPAMLRRLRGK